MMLGLAFILIALLAFANGANDVSKSVATLVGSGVADYRRALRWGAVWTLVGALLGGLFASSLAERFARSLGPAAGREPAIPLAVIIASLAWVTISSRMGLPVSTTHAITGAILGAAWVGEGWSPLARAEVLYGFVMPLLVSPLLAVAATLLLGPVVARVGQWLEARCACLIPAANLAPVAPAGGVASSGLELVLEQTADCQGRSVWSWNISVGQAHWISSAVVSLSRGMNDAPKLWALLFPLLLLDGPRGRLSLGAALALIALAMGLGSWAAGRRVTEVLGERLTRMGHHEGFAANLSTALLVAGASRLGLPVSTTHVSAGAIVGVGLGRGRRSVDWGVLRQIAMAWLVTPPVTAFLAITCYYLLG